MNLFKNLLKTALLRAGYVTCRFEQTYDASRARIIARNRVDMVLDVGANTGQYIQRIRNSGYSENICAFEPNVEVLEKLQAKFINDLKVSSFAVAFSDRDGEAEFRIASDSACSSLNDPTLEMVNLLPDARIIGRRKITIRRCDTFIKENQIKGDRILLKIDVQGHEQKVLDGAEGVMRNCKLVELELPVSNCYEDSPGLEDSMKRMQSRGFSLVSVGIGHYSPQTGQLLDIDCLFQKE